MKSRTFRFAAMVIAAMALMSTAKSATLVPYQISASKTCNAVSFCELPFPTTPANRRVEIEYINCLAAIMSGDLESITATVLPQDILLYVPISSTTEGSGVKAYFANMPTSAVVPAGNRIQIGANTFAPANIHINCAITGTLVFLP